MKLRGRHAIITGASQGLGRAIAQRYVEEGANVLLCARSQDDLRTLQTELQKRRPDENQILMCQADVANESDVDDVFALAERSFPKIDILVTNAGVYGPMGLIEDIDWKEWVDSIRINLMGTVYPCRREMPGFRQRRYGKIINISGGGATNPLPGISAYAAAKAAVVRFSETLALEARSAGIDVNAVAPGALRTRMMDQLLAAGPSRVGEAFYDRMKKLATDGGVPLEIPANLCVYLGSALSDGISGKLISAQWDPWETLHIHKDELSQSDIYALRRIIPADRGRPWGER